MPRFVRAFALKAACASTCAFSGIVLLATFAASRVSCAVSCTMSIVAAVEALHNLILRNEFFRYMINVIYVEAIGNASVCRVWIVCIYYDGVMELS